jgi:hypothetical protein
MTFAIALTLAVALLVAAVAFAVWVRWRTGFREGIPTRLSLSGLRPDTSHLVTVLYDGEAPDDEDAANAAVRAWLDNGEPLFVPTGTRIVLTKVKR